MLVKSCLKILKFPRESDVTVYRIYEMYKLFKDASSASEPALESNSSNMASETVNGAPKAAVDTDGAAAEPKTPKSHKSSIILMPPEDVWEQIQAIRIIHDPAFKRWMPHVNLTYPFIPDDLDGGQAFKDATERAQKVLARVQPFQVVLTKDSFQTFSHKKFQTMWLRFLDPVLVEQGITDKHHESVMDIQAKLEETFPDYSDLSQISEAKVFTPHMSLGKFKHKDVSKFMEEFKENWKDIEFEVNEVYFISRADYDDPFHVRHTVKLGISDISK